MRALVDPWRLLPAYWRVKDDVLGRCPVDQCNVSVQLAMGFENRCTASTHMGPDLLYFNGVGAVLTVFCLQLH